ncbi:MAG: type 4a pilus biogenesis protein PilO [Candidatus Omnitrophica bacterium]|nr:type 4a pilus biogenesis protein PilO [Candidatus Omnitrophota bacterium]
MKLKNLSYREKFIWLFLAAVVGFAFSFNYVVVPIAVVAKKLNKDIATKEHLLKKYSNFIKKGNDLSLLTVQHKEVLEAKANNDSISNDLFKSLKDAAKKWQLDVKKIRPLPIKKTKNYSKVFLDVELSGDFSSVFNFINDLEALATLIRVESFQLFNSNAAVNSLRYRVTFSRLFF